MSGFINHQYIDVRRYLAVCGAALIIFAACGRSAQAGDGTFDTAALLDREFSWLASLQLPSGAITETPLEIEGALINPYFACIACIALLERPAYAPRVQSYLRWHCEHQNADGTIYDAVAGTDPRETSLMDYDSSDSYAALFLEAARKYWRVTGDAAFIREIAPCIAQALRAIELTRGADGLTWAKPDYKIKYLMDNCEVYQGLKSAAVLFREVFDNERRAAELEASAQDTARALEEKFWNTGGGFYYAALEEEGPSRFSWETFYPDAVSQLYPVIYGVLRPDTSRARELYTKFNRHFSAGGWQWEELNTPDEYPWALLGYAAAMAGDGHRLTRFARVYSARYAELGHPYPAYCAEAAFLILALRYSEEPLSENTKN